MSEHLLNIREAAEYLGIGERKVKELADAGEIPAYRIGGTFLRFKMSQLAILKITLQEKSKLNTADKEAVVAQTKFDTVRDFFYFNDFYIASVAIIVIAVILITVT